MVAYCDALRCSYRRVAWCDATKLQNGGNQNLSLCYSVTRHGTGSAVIAD